MLNRYKIEYNDSTKDYYNTQLNANNVFKIVIDIDIIDLIENYFNTHIKNNYQNINFHTTSPSWNSDIKWTSVNNIETYNKFLKIFKNLNFDKIKQFIDFKDEIRCYSAFFVTRSYCKKPNFHTDFINTGNNAFTLMTPLTNIDDDVNGHLLFKDNDDNVHVYRYKRGDCIVFGDSFLHSTQPYEGKEVTFLCFTFGSDKETYWKNIFECIKGQQNNVMRYDNEYVNSLEEINRLNQL